MAKLNKKKNWYVVYVRPRHEWQAKEFLDEIGIETFLPYEIVQKKWSDRLKEVKVPLFKSYLFVKISENMFHPVIEIPSVVTFIKFNDQPEIVPQFQIDMVKIMLASKEKITVDRFNLKKGDLVKVKSGPLKGLTGELYEKRGKNKLALRMEVLNRIVSVGVNLRNVEYV